MATFNIKARIVVTLNGRKSSLFNKFKAGFEFVKESRTLGEINLIDRETIDLGDSAEVLIRFTSDRYLGDLNEKSHFTFHEGELLIGEGQVLEVIGREY